VTRVSPERLNIYEVLTHERLALTREAISQLDQKLSK
jgi:ribosomal protein L4